MPEKQRYDSVRNLLTKPAHNDDELHNLRQSLVHELMSLAAEEESEDEDGVLKNHSSYYGQSLLMLAVWHNRYDVIDLVYEYFPDPIAFGNTKGLNAYRIACSRGEQSPCAVFLRKYGLTDKLYNPLELAIVDNDLEEVPSLVQNIEVDLRRITRILEDGGRNPYYDPDFTKRLISNPKIISLLLVNKDPKSSYAYALKKLELEAAILSGEIKEIERLSKEGATINILKLQSHTNEGKANNFYDPIFRDSLRKPEVIKFLIKGTKNTSIKEFETLELEAAVMTNNVQEVRRLASLGRQIDVSEVGFQGTGTFMEDGRLQPYSNPYYNPVFTTAVLQPLMLDALLSGSHLEPDYVAFLSSFKIKKIEIVTDVKLEGENDRRFLRKILKTPINLAPQTLDSLRKDIQQLMSRFEEKSKSGDVLIPNRDEAVKNLFQEIEKFYKLENSLNSVEGQKAEALKNTVAAFVKLDIMLVNHFNSIKSLLPEEKSHLPVELGKIIEGFYAKLSTATLNEIDDYCREFEIELRKTTVSNSELTKLIDVIHKFPVSEDKDVNQQVESLKKVTREIFQDSKLKSFDKLKLVQKEYNKFLDPITLDLQEAKSTLLNVERKEAKAVAEAKINSIPKKSKHEREQLKQEFYRLDLLVCELYEVKNNYGKSNEEANEIEKMAFKILKLYREGAQLKNIGPRIFKQLKDIIDKKQQQHNEFPNKLGRQIGGFFGIAAKPEPDLNFLIRSVMAKFPEFDTPEKNPEATASVVQGPSCR